MPMLDLARPARRRTTFAAAAVLVALALPPAAHGHHGNAPPTVERPITAATIYGQAGPNATGMACTFGSATGTPNANGDTRFISFSSSVVCTSGALEINHTKTELEDLDGGTLATAPQWGPFQGDQGHTGAYYTRTHPGQLQRIETEFYLQIIDTGSPNIGWHVVPPMCTKLSRLRVRCNFTSGAFTYMITTIPFSPDPDAIEEDQDNFTDGAPFAPTPDAETEAMYQLEDPPVASTTDESAWRMPEDVCNAGQPCPSFTMTPDTQLSDVPAWVRELPSFAATLGTDGVLGKTTTFWASDVSATAEATYADCPYRFACLWRHAGYRGYMVKFNQVSHYYDLGLYNIRNRASSARNRGIHLALCGDAFAGSSIMWDWLLPKRHNTPNMGYYNDATVGVMIQNPPCD